MRLNFNFSLGGAKKELAATPTEQPTGRKLTHTPKSVYQTRKDIKDWITAQALAESGEIPRNYAIQLLYTDIRKDALLYGIIQNRMQQLFSSNFLLKMPNGEVDEAQTDLLKNMPAYRILTTAILDSVYYGYSLVQIDLEKNIAGNYQPVASVLPRTNVVPQTGLFYPDYSDDLKHIAYRELTEFGTYILEFNTGEIGLLNKTVSHGLFKRFAQGCWSELCEIFGIPPRVIKTNTQDKGSLDRAEQMLRDTGSAPWFIIDDAETFEWGQATATNGDVFHNLIALCNNEMSMAINGAVMGQDTKHGNRSKEQVSAETLWLLVQSDMALVTESWNTIILPAFKKLGVLKGDLAFEFEPAEDLGELWTRTKDALQYYNIDANWVKDKFGLEITGERQQVAATPAKGQNLGLDHFFD